MILNNEEKKSLVNSLSWMIEDMKHKYDDLKGNLEEGSQSDYSDKLKEVIKLLDDIKKTETIETTGYHRKAVLLNCREFKCPKNQQGICTSTKVTLERIGSYVLGHLKCVEAEEKEEEQKL